MGVAFHNSLYCYFILFISYLLSGGIFSLYLFSVCSFYFLLHWASGSPRCLVSSYLTGQSFCLFPFLVLPHLPDLMLKPKAQSLGPFSSLHTSLAILSSPMALYIICILIIHFQIYTPALKSLNFTICSEHCLLSISTWVFKR